MESSEGTKSLPLRLTKLAEVGERDALAPHKHPVPLFELSPQGTPPQLRTLSSSPSGEPINYDILSCTIPNDSVHTATLDGAELSLPEVLVSALHHVQLPDRPRVIFNDHLASLHTEASEVRRIAEALPQIHRQAEQVVIWAGTDDEDDALYPFIGPGTRESTERAFESAHRLATTPFSDIPDLFNNHDDPKTVPSWVHLQRLAFRPYFRGDAILFSNYIDGLENVVIQVSSSTIPYSIFLNAADRLLQAHPLPPYLTTLSLHPPCHTEGKWRKVPDGWTPENWAATLSYKSHLEASIRFSLPTQLLAVQLLYTINKIRDTYPSGPDKDALLSRLTTHIGFSGTLLDSRGGWRSDTAAGLVKAFHGQLDRSKGRVSAEMVEDPVGEGPRATPDWDGGGKKVVSEAEMSLVVGVGVRDREGFVHAMASYDEDRSLVLLEILPDREVGAVVQCQLREIPREGEDGAGEGGGVEFAWVDNHGFLKAPLYEEDTQAKSEIGGGKEYISPPLSSRSNAQILINGRGYTIPKLQEIFLKMYRDDSDECKSKFVHLWNVCRRPNKVGMYRVESMEGCVKTKKRYLEGGSGVHRVFVVDMYQWLQWAGSWDKGDLRRLGKPDGVGWRGWLLELAD